MLKFADGHLGNETPIGKFFTSLVLPLFIQLCFLLRYALFAEQSFRFTKLLFLKLSQALPSRFLCSFTFMLRYA